MGRGGQQEKKRPRKLWNLNRERYELTDSQIEETQVPYFRRLHDPTHRELFLLEVMPDITQLSRDEQRFVQDLLEKDMKEKEENKKTMKQFERYKEVYQQFDRENPNLLDEWEKGERLREELWDGEIHEVASSVIKRDAKIYQVRCRLERKHRLQDLWQLSNFSRLGNNYTFSRKIHIKHQEEEMVLSIMEGNRVLFTALNLGPTRPYECVVPPSHAKIEDTSRGFPGKNKEEIRALEVKLPWPKAYRREHQGHRKQPSLAELLNVDFSDFQRTGVIAMWAPTEYVSTGRQKLRTQGYRILKEIEWIQVNPWGKMLMRSGKHTMNTRECCILATKGISLVTREEWRRIVPSGIVSCSRTIENKPVEMKKLLEELYPVRVTKPRHAELFGNSATLRRGWCTVVKKDPFCTTVPRECTGPERV